MNQPQLTGLEPRGKGWTSFEITTLRQNAHLGAHACAALLGRSVKSVKRKAEQKRISLRKPGERRGLILGQNRGTSWIDQKVSGIDPARLEALRRDVLSGEVDMTILEQRVRDAVLERHRPLCPWCGQRPQERATTGLCEPCHWRELARAHRDSVERTAARRELDAARQEASRARRRSTAPIPLFDE